MAHDNFFPKRAQLGLGLQPIETEFHDVLVIPPLSKSGESRIGPEEFFRFAVIKKHKDPARPGTYEDPPELWDEEDAGQRKVLSIAQPHRGKSATAGVERGPVFSIMPVKQEPGASSCAFCYLIDAKNARSPHAWTAEEWDAPTTEDLQPDPAAEATQAEVLLALPRGNVLLVQLAGLDKLDTLGKHELLVDADWKGVKCKVTALHLEHEAEVWGQLRNGCIAGRAYVHREKKVIPLVSVTSLVGPASAVKGGQP